MDGRLMFNGNYLNWKKNGEGICYYSYNSLYNDNVKFIGEFLDDKMWNGKGYERCIYKR